MHHDKHHVGWKEGEHPSPELLRQYHADALLAPQSYRVERHLLDCELCADTLEGMVLSDAESTGAAVAELNRRIATRVKSDRQRTVPTGWQMAAAVLLLLCTAFVVVYYNYRNQQEEQRNLAANQEIQAIDIFAPPAPAERLAKSGAVREAAPTIAMAPPRTVEKKTVPIIKYDAEVIDAFPEEELVSEEEAEEKARVAPGVLQDRDTPSTATAPPPAAETVVTETAPLRIADAPATAPESSRVSMALQGKAAGVIIRGRSSLGKAEEKRVVTGQVLSEDGQPLPGVTIQLKGTGTGTLTDEKGHYKLPVTGEKPTLLFNYIGYATAEKSVPADTAQVNVSMAPDFRALSEVVVTGYGVAEPGAAPAVVSAKPAAGLRAYRKYLRENLRPSSEGKGERGRVVVGFTVSASGELIDVKVLKSLCPACDAEAVRLVKEGPGWKPATQAGTPVPQQVEVVVPFRLNSR